MKLKLKILSQWAVLKSDASIDFSFTSPIFNDDGDFSYPFELPISQNSHIFHNINLPLNSINLHQLNHQPAEIWFEGNCIFFGITELDDSVEIDSDTIEINVVAKRGSLSTQIDGLSCKDIPLKDDIYLGWKLDTAVMTGGDKVYVNNDHDPGYRTLNQLTNFDMPEMNTKFFRYNIDKPYPLAPFCNVNICCPNASDDSSSSSTSAPGYVLIPYDRLDTAPCFYVLYFLDCLFAYLGIDFDNSCLTDKSNRFYYEDLSRLAFVNFKAHYTPRKDEKKNIPLSDSLKNFHEFGAQKTQDKFYDPYEYAPDSSSSPQRSQDRNYFYPFRIYGKEAVKSLGLVEEPQNVYCYYMTFSVKREIESFDIVPCFASSDNFPETEVSNLLSDLQNAFGIRFIYDPSANRVHTVLLKDVFNDNTVLKLPAKMKESPHVTRSLNYGTILSYGGSEDDTAYNYSMPSADKSAWFGSEEAKQISKGIILHKNYSSIISMPRSKTDNNTHLDVSTGNAYRIKVKEETGDEPQLFEVGAFCDYSLGVIDKDKVETININFQPVALNDVYEFVAGSDDNPQQQQMLMVYSDSDMYGKKSNVQCYDGNGNKKTKNSVISSKGEVVKYNDTTMENILPKYDTDRSYFGNLSMEIFGDAIVDISSEFDPNTELPLESSQQYMLGFMRGGGDSDGKTFLSDFDGEGNITWTSVSTQEAFTSDSIDNFANEYNYGDGSNTTNRLSLKLEARKVQSYNESGEPVFYECADKYAKRGLVPQLLYEYLHFVHNKITVTIPVEITIDAILNIDFTKKYKINNFTGYINKIDFTIDNNGISNATVELFTLNN